MKSHYRLLIFIFAAVQFSVGICLSSTGTAFAQTQLRPESGYDTRILPQEWLDLLYSAPKASYKLIYNRDSLNKRNIPESYIVPNATDYLLANVVLESDPANHLVPVRFEPPYDDSLLRLARQGSKDADLVAQIKDEHDWWVNLYLGCITCGIPDMFETDENGSWYAAKSRPGYLNSFVGELTTAPLFYHGDLYYIRMNNGRILNEFIIAPNNAWLFVQYGEWRKTSHGVDFPSHVVFEYRQRFGFRLDADDYLIEAWLSEIENTEYLWIESLTETRYMRELDPISGLASFPDKSEMLYSINYRFVPE